MSSSVKPPAFAPPLPGVVEIAKGKPKLPAQGQAPAGSAKPTSSRVTQPGSQSGIAGGKGGGRSSGDATDADGFFRTELVDIRSRASRGEPVYAIFSIDDVLCDTRWRTLAIAKAFDVAHDSHHFDNLTLAQVGATAEETSRRLALPAQVRKPFAQHWDSVFWNASNYELDRPLTKLMSLVRAAEAAGADVVYLTARFDSVRAQTMAQLKRFGLPLREQMLFTRPDAIPSPESFKHGTLAQWQKARVRVAWFVTASRAEVSFLQRHLPELPCVLLETPWRAASTEPIRDDTWILSLTE